MLSGRARANAGSGRPRAGSGRRADAGGAGRTPPAQVDEARRAGEGTDAPRSARRRTNSPPGRAGAERRRRRDRRTPKAAQRRRPGAADRSFVRGRLLYERRESTKKPRRPSSRRSPRRACAETQHPGSASVPGRVAGPSRTLSRSRSAVSRRAALVPAQHPRVLAAWRCSMRRRTGRKRSRMC